MTAFRQVIYEGHSAAVFHGDLNIEYEVTVKGKATFLLTLC